jgi:hypothetical protein
MGTCPKCKLRIRRNGNHVKLGSTWYHKLCPTRKGSRRKTAVERSVTPASART